MLRLLRVLAHMADIKKLYRNVGGELARTTCDNEPYLKE
jgi:hypothetical protein